MKKFTYYPRCGFIIIIGWFFLLFLAYLTLSMALKDIDYIEIRHTGTGFRQVSPMFSTVYYLFFSIAPISFVIVIGYSCVKARFSSRIIKANRTGILLPRPKMYKMLRYDEIDSLYISDEKIDIESKKNSIKIFENHFDNEFKFRELAYFIKNEYNKSKHNRSQDLMKG